MAVKKTVKKSISDDFVRKSDFQVLSTRLYSHLDDLSCDMSDVLSRVHNLEYSNSVSQSDKDKDKDLGRSMLFDWNKVAGFLVKVMFVGITICVVVKTIIDILMPIIGA